MFKLLLGDRIALLNLSQTLDMNWDQDQIRPDPDQTGTYYFLSSELC